MPDLSSYEAAREWLYSLKNAGSKYGIDRMERFADALGQPQRSFPSIHVAGTNGKGSTCAMLEQVFRDQGFKTGLSTSPHLVRQGERIQVNRRILSEEAILDFVRELAPLASAIAQPDAELHPSFFEFMTAMAFLRFQREAVDIALVEVGLGGRLDATNVLVPECSVITSIGLDHCEILGDSHAAIAREKGGIIKPGVPVVAGLLPEDAMAEVRSICRERGCELITVAERFGEDLESFPRTNLYGRYQRINAAIAMTVVEAMAGRFGLDRATAEASLASVSWPGRWEERQLRHRKIVFDVSHNSEGARWLDDNLADLVERSGGAKPDVVMGVMGGYRASSLVPVAAKWARSITFVVPQQSRACSLEELASFVPDDFEGAVERGEIARIFPSKGVCSLDQHGAPPLVVTGSIYLIGEIWDRFLEESPLGQGALQDF
ncbi:folylpolyglutamate synthase/dihydrofolate synthase family protein [Pelagicoccus sp. SDUM812003]|uniref:bifunctional folylpolyglutamate synthase/dihydrofolate synthase n=1 Tax=Pelagicoccus sp. SDUM812003 TaxID=3041267 RepID=UPI00280F9E77|nr:folylpolyglutamate synthase/dihydrofolate synthase family protein [Pelagicoccus sp. SDUM812003]MDQ8203671.1 bifunctional folylpolyglutamate synthase/dihydrofolate synthase [Pelagicoccus sp. SDUM812003]